MSSAADLDLLLNRMCDLAYFYQAELHCSCAWDNECILSKFAHVWNSFLLLRKSVFFQMARWEKLYPKLAP